MDLVGFCSSVMLSLAAELSLKYPTVKLSHDLKPDRPGRTRKHGYEVVPNIPNASHPLFLPFRMGVQRDYLRLHHVGRIRRQARGSRLLSGRQLSVDTFGEKFGRPGSR